MPERTYHRHVEVTVDVIGGKWTPVVLAHLKENDRLRFAELRRMNWGRYWAAARELHVDPAIAPTVTDQREPRDEIATGAGR